MSNPLVQSRLGAIARVATTAIFALLLLVAGWTPARGLPALAGAGAGAQTAVAGLAASAATSWRHRAPASLRAAERAPDQPFDTAVASQAPLRLAGTAIAATGARPSITPARAPRRATTRAPPARA